MPLAPSMDCPGPITATLLDMWQLHRQIADTRSDPGTEGPGRYTIGVLEGFFDDAVHEEVAASVRAATGVLEARGVRVERRDGRGIEDGRRVWMDVCTPEFADAHPLLKDPERRRLVSPQVVEWLERGERVTSNEREFAAHRREEIRRWYLDRLEGLDALLIPTTPYPAPGADGKGV